MKTHCKLSLAMLVPVLIFGTTLLPSAVFSSATSMGSRIPPLGTMPLSSTSTSATTSSGSLGNPNVVPPNSNVEGKSYAEWSVAWWQWTLSHPFDQGPGDLTGQFFPMYQTGSVWFLQGAFGPLERSCTMPSDTYLVCPLILFENDYPCPDPNFQPAPGQSLEDFLTAGAKAVIDGIPTSPFPVSLEVDGVALKNLASYRTTSKLFTFTGDLSMQANFDPCITGSSQAAVSDGYLVILKPLRPGAHTLHFSGFGDIVVHLTVTK